MPEGGRANLSIRVLFQGQLCELGDRIKPCSGPEPYEQHPETESPVWQFAYK